MEKPIQNGRARIGTGDHQDVLVKYGNMLWDSRGESGIKVGKE
jgi:hypothetical protein